MKPIVNTLKISSKMGAAIDATMIYASITRDTHVENRYDTIKPAAYVKQ